MAVVEAEGPRTSSKPSAGSPWPPRILNGCTLIAFLALTFLLGVFPLKDTDFWWHLKEGDLLRKTGAFPTVDTFTYGADGHPWIDLHWTYQVLISWGYDQGGVPLLNLAKCVVTTLAVLLLVAAKKKDWPWEAMLPFWLPALLTLGGRMYIRPETITLLYLCSYLAILFRLDDRPRLAYLLPLVQALWVNVQGLFILGPVVLAFYLIDAALRREAFSKKRRGWWITVMRATGLVGLACLFNPYGLMGALYPLQLAATMRNPVFSETIGELQSIPAFIAKAGTDVLALRLHFAVIGFGAISFLAPFAWRIAMLGRDRSKFAEIPDSKKKSKKSTKSAKSSGLPSAAPSVFRLLLFVAFTGLSLQATRNSHQFAAVVGALTAWNFGELTAEIRRRRIESGREVPNRSPIMKAAVLGLVVLTLVWVGSGRFYTAMGEGRTIGLGEEPLWFPHEAVNAAGREGMPNKSICFHNGHAALYEYAYAPDRKTYADARLEVVGAEIYARYLEIQRKIKANDPHWRRELDLIDRPLVLVDNVHPLDAGMNATLLTSGDWKCVWFDPVAALYVHESYRKAVERDGVDFLVRHFGCFADGEPADPARHLALAKTYWSVVYSLIPKPGENPLPNWRETSKPLIAIGLDHVRRLRSLAPEKLEGWKYDGLLEFFRDLPGAAVNPRFRLGFDPVQDLSAVKATHSLRRAREISPEDGNTLVTLVGLWQGRGLNEAALEAADAFLARPNATPEQRSTRERILSQRPMLVSALGEAPGMEWRNLNELSQILNQLLNQGRADSAARLLERAYPPESRPWEISDRIATYRLNLGDAPEARRLWLEATDAPDPALSVSRAAAAAYAAGDLTVAREGYAAAITKNPKLFEALFGLAVVEFDAGDAAAALGAATRAADAAPDEAAKSAALTIADTSRRHVNPSR